MPLLVAALAAVTLVACGTSGDETAPEVPSEITFPASDSPPDLTVRIREGVTLEQVDDLAAEVSAQVPPVATSSQIDMEARALLLYLRSDATDDERRALREMLLRSPIVAGIEP